MNKKSRVALLTKKENLFSGLANSFSKAIIFALSLKKNVIYPHNLRSTVTEVQISNY